MERVSEVKVGEAEKSSEEDFHRTLKVMLLHVLSPAFKQMSCAVVTEELLTSPRNLSKVACLAP